MNGFGFDFKEKKEEIYLEQRIYLNNLSRKINNKLEKYYNKDEIIKLTIERITKLPKEKINKIIEIELKENYKDILWRIKNLVETENEEEKIYKLIISKEEFEKELVKTINEIEKEIKNVEPAYIIEEEGNLVPIDKENNIETDEIKRIAKIEKYFRELEKSKEESFLIDISEVYNLEENYIKRYYTKSEIAVYEILSKEIGRIINNILIEDDEIKIKRTKENNCETIEIDSYNSDITITTTKVKKINKLNLKTMYERILTEELKRLEKELKNYKINKTEINKIKKAIKENIKSRTFIIEIEEINEPITAINNSWRGDWFYEKSNSFKIIYGKYEDAVETSYEADYTTKRNYFEKVKIIPRSKVLVIKYYSTYYGETTEEKIVIYIVKNLKEMQKFKREDILFEAIKREIGESNFEKIKEILNKYYTEKEKEEFFNILSEYFEKGYKITVEKEVTVETGSSDTAGSWDAGYSVKFGEVNSELIEEEHKTVNPITGVGWDYYKEKLTPETPIAVVRYCSSGAVDSWNEDKVYILVKNL